MRGTESNGRVPRLWAWLVPTTSPRMCAIFLNRIIRVYFGLEKKRFAYFVHIEFKSYTALFAFFLCKMDFNYSVAETRFELVISSLWGLRGRPNSSIPQYISIFYHLTIRRVRSYELFSKNITKKIPNFFGLGYTICLNYFITSVAYPIKHSRPFPTFNRGRIFTRFYFNYSLLRNHVVVFNYSILYTYLCFNFLYKFRLFFCNRKIYFKIFYNL